MPFWSWSKTAASNATADTSINWAEGQSPSSVNDSARAMMARTAEWRDDVSGALTTSGTATAYTLASNQGFDSFAHMAGALIAFVPHATCGATVTLNVDSLGARPLRSSPGVELPSGLLIQGTPYAAAYNNSDGAFYLRGFYSLPYAIPIGGIIPYVGASAPNSSFAVPYGQAISRTAYAGLFTLVGTTFGGGDGSTTFNIPDLRGRVVAGLDNMGGSAANRISSVATDNGTIVGTTVGSTGGSATHTQASGEIGQHTHGVTDPGHVHGPAGGAGFISNSSNGAAATAGPAYIFLSTTGSATTGITVNNSSSPSAMAWLQPTIILPFILRVV
jgi:microcystin-dependent protein